MAATSVTLIKILGKLLNCLLFNYVAMITTYFVLCESQNVNLHPPVSQKIMIVCISLSRLSAERVFSRPRLLAAAAGAPPRRSPSPTAGSPGFNPHALPLVAGTDPAWLGRRLLPLVAGGALPRLRRASGAACRLPEQRAWGEVLTVPWPQGGRELNQLPAGPCAWPGQ